MLAVGLILYSTFSVLFQKEKKYRSRAYVEGDDSTVSKKTANLLDKLARKRVKLSYDKEEQMKLLLSRAGWKETPEDIATQQIMYGGIGVVALTFAAILFKTYYLFIAAPVAGVVCYRYPIFVLKGALKKKLREIQYELPDLIDLFVLLNSAGCTPYQAIQKAAETAPPSLKLHTERLAAEMDAMTHEQALDRFADSIGLPAAKRFIFAMKQSFDMSPVEAQQIFKTQSKFIRELRVQNQRTLIKERPGKVQLVSYGVFAFVVAIPFALFFLTFVNSFSSFN